MNPIERLYSVGSQPRTPRVFFSSHTLDPLRIEISQGLAKNRVLRRVTNQKAANSCLPVLGSTADTGNVSII